MDARQQALRTLETLLLQHGFKVLDIKWLKASEFRSLAFNLVTLRLSVSDIADHFGVRTAVDTHMQAQIFRNWKEVVDEHGMQAFNQQWLRQHKLVAVFARAQKRNLSIHDAIVEMGYEQEHEEHTRGIGRNGGKLWNSQVFDATARSIIEIYGTIPGFEFLLANGYGGFCGQVYKFSSGIEDLRKKYSVQNVVLQSFDHQSWASLAEVAFANYLLARGIQVLKGKRYPAAYAEKYNRHYGIYDNHFRGLKEPYIGREISTEIFGGGPRNSELRCYYEETRMLKEDFHSHDPCFLSVDYDVCYSENRLKQCLFRYIGDPPVIHQHPIARVPTTMLSLADSVIAECKDLCSKLPAGHQELPSLDWLLRRRSYADRVVFPWEKKSWGSLAGIIQKIGFPQVRAALNEHVPDKITWDKDETVDQFEKLLEKHNQTACALKIKLRSQERLTNDEKTLLVEVNYLDQQWREHFKDVGRQSVKNIRNMIALHRN